MNVGIRPIGLEEEVFFDILGDDDGKPENDGMKLYKIACRILLDSLLGVSLIDISEEMLSDLFVLYGGVVLSRDCFSLVNRVRVYRGLDQTALTFEPVPGAFTGDLDTCRKVVCVIDSKRLSKSSMVVSFGGDKAVGYYYDDWSKPGESTLVCIEGFKVD
ncbi:MAG: hypothetical protein WC517_02460 [Patescibacteria group bacterium]